MNISDELLGAGLALCSLLGALGSGGKRSFVVEAVKVATGLLELFDPFLGLQHGYFSLFHAREGFPEMETCRTSEIIM